MRFTLRGKSYEITKEDIIKAVEGIEPRPIRKYYVEINGEHYPIRQVLSVALNIPPASFTTMDAYRILANLGFEVKTKDEY